MKFREYNEHTSISDSNGDWNILFIPDPTYAELYATSGEELLFFPEENLMDSTDFLEVYYQTDNYHGIIRQTCHEGTPSVFSEINANHYGVLYGQIIDEMASLAVDIQALQTLNDLIQSNSVQENEQMEGIDEW